MAQARMTGGCQCGAVRYAFEGVSDHVALCHCRMCQKATGSVAWPFFTVRLEQLSWTRGKPTLYRSSAMARRGFCVRCGTSLTFEPDGEGTVDVGVGTLDEPAAMIPTAQYWIGTRVPWFGNLVGLPVAGLGEKLPEDEIARRKPFQHPDHDTGECPPAGGGR